jgi:hypothetical protein
MPFDNRGPIKKKGIKINNENSSVPSPKPDASAVLDEQAKKAISKYEDYKQRTWELSTKFKGMVEDKTLSDNKSVLTRGIETEVLNKLVVLASEMNEDDTQPEGIGSTALSFLLMKMILLQRDTINALLYKVEKLEKSKAHPESNKDK